MIYAPVVIPTLCRFEHFVACIDSLKKNELAKYTELYIGLDYPTKESHWSGYNKIKELLDEGIEGFAYVHIFIRQENLGALENVHDLLKKVREKHDRYILSEDDNVFSPQFLDFENKMLEASQKDDSVFAVCGYSYPVDWVDSQKIGVIKLQSFFSAWGYGMLFEKRDKFWEIYTEDFLETTIRDKEKMYKLKNCSPKNFVDYINIVWFQKIRDFDVNYNSYLLLENMYSLLPCKSLVRNCGWDGSGIHCNYGSYDYNNQPIASDNFVKYKKIGGNTSVIQHNDENEKIINCFYPGEKVAMIKAIIKLFVMRLGLKKVYFKLKEMLLRQCKIL